jgi:hypothetical protein
VKETEFVKLGQVLIATFGLLGLALLLAPRTVLGVLTRGHLQLSRATILFFRLVGALGVLGACARLFWHA